MLAAYVLVRFVHWFRRHDDPRHNDYLLAATDLADIERRMRNIERNNLPY